MDDPDWIKNLERWQTLISGVSALYAAVVGAYFLNRQTQQAAKIEADRLARNLAAVRSTLPFLLSTIHSNMKEVASELMRLHDDGTQSASEAAREAFKNVDVPQPIISGLQKFIEAESRSDIVSVVSEMLSEFQILSARIQSIKIDEHMLILKINTENYIAQCAKIVALASLLFPYARRERDVVVVEDFANELRVAAHVLHIDENLYEKTFDYIRDMKMFRGMN